jgi:hypothetical protein
MAWASHSLYYTFEISGGKEGQRLSPNRNGQDQLDLNLLSAIYVSAKAERPEPVRLTRRPPVRQAVKAEEKE